MGGHATPASLLRRLFGGRCHPVGFTQETQRRSVIFAGPDCGEPQINVVPAGAYVALDVRTLPDQPHEELVGKLEKVLFRLSSEDPDFDATMEVTEERPPTQTPADEPVVRAMDAAHRALTGEQARYEGVPGATDGTFLHAWAGIPIVTTGAGKREVSHQTDEWADEEELLTARKLYAATAMLYVYGKDQRCSTTARCST